MLYGSYPNICEVSDWLATGNQQNGERSDTGFRVTMWWEVFPLGCLQGPALGSLPFRIWLPCPTSQNSVERPRGSIRVYQLKLSSQLLGLGIKWLMCWRCGPQPVSREMEPLSLKKIPLAWCLLWTAFFCHTLPPLCFWLATDLNTLNQVPMDWNWWNYDV